MRPADASTQLWRWLDARLNDAAEGFAAMGERLRPRRKLAFVQREDGALMGPPGVYRLDNGQCVFAGARAPNLRNVDVEFRLLPDRCMFRELELPAGAGEFLEGVVRAQLDRLTPWRPSEAAFGFSAAARSADRIQVTVAATKRQPIAALLDVAADSVVVTTARGDATPIALLSRRSGASARRARWRFSLIAALAVSLLLVLASFVAQLTLGEQLRQQADALTADLAQRRAVLLRRERVEDDPSAQALDARKRTTPAAVVALEALTRAIPDDAYITQLRLSGDKLEISGVGADPAGLIKHIEQSPHFSRAEFTAPTTRGPDEREIFRIEAHVAPLNGVTP
jgi:general secretion pathway protein L